MTAERREAVVMPTILIAPVLIPSPLAVSSPVSRALKSHRYKRKRKETGNRARAVIMRDCRYALPKSPKVQARMLASCTLSARYCSRVRPAEKSDPRAMPARIMLSAEILVKTVRIRIAAVERMEKKKAENVTVHGLLIIMVEVVPVPAPRNTMAKEAPKAAALDRPRVYGDASGFLKTDCITVPDRDNPAPTSSAARILGILTSQITLPKPVLSNRIRTDRTSLKGIRIVPDAAETIMRAARIRRDNARNTIFRSIYFLYRTSTEAAPSE